MPGLSRFQLYRLSRTVEFSLSLFYWCIRYCTGASLGLDTWSEHITDIIDDHSTAVASLGEDRGEATKAAPYTLGHIRGHEK